MKWITNAPSLVREINQPKSFFLTEFTPQTLRAFSNCITLALELNQKILPIHITSFGGSALMLNGFLGLMDGARRNDLKFATVVHGCAMSSGFFVFAYGDKDMRFCAPCANLMAHYGQLGVEGSVLEVKSYIEFITKEEVPFLEKISKHLGKKKDWLQKKLDNNVDWHLTPEDALREGICSHIHVPTFSVNIECEIAIT